MGRIAAAVLAAGLATLTYASPIRTHHGLSVQLSVADGLLNSSIDGRIVLLLAPAGVDPLEDQDVITSPDHFFGKNVYKFDGGDTAFLAGGAGFYQPKTGVYGYPNVSLDDVAAGDYVSVKFPCGDGSLPVDGPGSLTTVATNITVSGNPQVEKLTFTDITPVEDFNGTEIGGCSQYVGANILLPHGYQANDTTTRYPTLYHQNHWAADAGAYNYLTNEAFAAAWDSGIIPETNITAERETPKMIIVQFRHETAFYDDSYAVNTANIGPYGDALNDELLPYLEKTFNMISAPYARVQDGGSTGGWESIANTIFRPDLFGVCFSSYPDSLDFHRHQAIPLYSVDNAYTLPSGENITSIRENINGTLTNVTAVLQENHWELTFGTSSRSQLQWDVWNAVFGAQGYNNYPLEPWDKVTGEVFHEAVEYWKPMDLGMHVATNWDNELNLGKALAGRIFVYVGSWDNYFLNLGVLEFQKTVDAKGGPGWANITVLEEQPHGGNYQRREIWNYLDLVAGWVQDHAPNGTTPLSADATSPSTRGNKWEDVIARGGHQAAVARQSWPVAHKDGRSVHASVGTWDPGMKLTAQWIVNSKPVAKPVAVKQGDSLTSKKHGKMQLAVTGHKRGYTDETRRSNTIATW
ncbi:hypothetical protein LTR56_009804 [Elasticomyces elasticus]|nr:hypothetical protein LTR56_009804 [Elasticomyces elasticus]KAK3653473.1 hypothetical protein LTR22_011147 [Elasticomyces elasticus]KAK4906923.1 hypothetical protein LTR49_024016 [Elasticomyces elasticus]KAK5746955.1 hypothetical protein LTS12_022576 [Elasticomyces elasticus]